MREQLTIAQAEELKKQYTEIIALELETADFFTGVRVEEHGYSMCQMCTYKLPKKDEVNLELTRFTSREMERLSDFFLATEDSKREDYAQRQLDLAEIVKLEA